MIRNKEDLKRYIHQDRLMNGVPSSPSIVYRVMHWFAPLSQVRYLELLRKQEYSVNTGKMLRYFYMFKKRRLGLKLGYSIPANVFGPGLSLPHYGTIVVSKYARIGENCRLHVCTNIGASAGKEGAPHIGNNVYIGPGAIIFGNIDIADNTTIAANATVNKSCDIPNVILAGTPAKIVKEEYDNWVAFNKVK